MTAALVDALLDAQPDGQTPERLLDAAEGDTPEDLIQAALRSAAGAKAA